MRRIYTTVILLLLATTCFAAKMSTYPKVSTLNNSDQILVTVDPTGTATTKAINWADIYALLPSGGAVNWSQLPLVASNQVNWTDVKNLEIQTSGINWSWDTTCLQDGTNCPASGAVNWEDIRAAQIHTDGINWNESIAAPITATGFQIADGSTQYIQAINTNNPTTGNSEGMFAGQDSDNNAYYFDGTAWRKILTDAVKIQNTGINWASLDKDVASGAINWAAINQEVQRGSINWNDLENLTDGLNIGGTRTTLANGAACFKSDGITLGYCSSVVASDGTCTCN